MSIKQLAKKLLTMTRPKRVVRVNIVQRKNCELLKGKNVLITGGSSGFGFAMAKRFIECGANVIITGRDHNKLNTAITRLDSVNVKSLIWDISSIEMMPQKYEEASSLFGPIDIAINNAGVWTPSKWQEVSEPEWNKIIETNLKGLFFICKVEAELMARDTTKVNKIINITSIEGIRGGFGPYWASKWGANGLTKGLAKELTSKNVLVNAIAPGMGITDINPNLPKDGNLALNNLNGRFVAVEEVAELAIFLASDSSNSIVGQVIAIDGGMSLN